LTSATLMMNLRIVSTVPFSNLVQIAGSPPNVSFPAAFGSLPKCFSK